MGNLLLRGVDQALKMRLEETARRNGRSISEEAIDQLQRALPTPDDTGTSAGGRLRAILGEERFDDADIEAISAFRHQPDREPPRFDG
ncbi:FitA-like ribbon-helix-helix domain-containing protein [Rhizobium tumorigenes]|uniref:FitA-like ribbon-helix-helix domain-containing protein n=1 Tax=Rhizobium tumorigenes TaxID=2041385 RepID=UPI00241D3405|nr:plasmid stabilization protein [Rhizobium tumorigenes]WFS01120.1 plasmid stabilization protein [Rhizobium tumorigenes]